MARTVVNFGILFLVLLLAQVLIFNNLILFHCAMAMVFVYFYIRMPMSWSPSVVMSTAFVMGFFVDVFSDTLGMNTLASVVLCGARPVIFTLYSSHDDVSEVAAPSMRTMGTGPYLKYALSMVVLYCLLVYVIEAFGFFDIGRLVLRIVASSIFTGILIVAIDSINLRLR